MKPSSQSISVQAKQAYVYNNIFQGDYDIEVFAEFLAQQPPKYTSNLEELSFEQIKFAVDTFMNKNQGPKSKVNFKNSQRQSVLTESRMEKLVVDYKDIEFYMKTRECVKEINKFALTSIQVNVVSFRKNQGNFLRRDYITFKIQLPQLHKQIDRRYSHFEWLRDILTYFHPGVVIPPLPKKKMKKIFTQNHLKKKGKMLQNFLRKSLEIPDLRNDQNLYRFLTITAPEKFEEFIKQNKVEKGFAPYQKIKSATGQVQYGINQELIKINKVAADYFQKFTPFMKEIYKQVKRVKQGLSQCALHLEILELTTKKFAPTEEQFRRDCNMKEFSEDDEREKSFIETISVIAENYKENLKAMSQIWQKELYHKMKYEFHFSQNMVGFINEYQADERKFHGLKDSLNKKKQKLYSKQMSEWGLHEEKVAKFLNQKPSFNEAAPFMLWRKTEQVKNAQDFYALQTKQLYNSVVHYAQQNNLYILRSVERFLQKEHELQNGWSVKLKEMIREKFEFSLTEIMSAKEKLIGNVSGMVVGGVSGLKSAVSLGGEKNPGSSSIKGFFSQFTVNKAQQKSSNPYFQQNEH